MSTSTDVSPVSPYTIGIELFKKSFVPFLTAHCGKPSGAYANLDHSPCLTRELYDTLKLLSLPGIHEL